MNKKQKLIALGVVIKKRASIDSLYRGLRKPDITTKEEIQKVMSLVEGYCEEHYPHLGKIEVRRIKEYVTMAFAFPAALMGEKSTRGVRMAIADALGETKSNNIVSIDLKQMRGFYNTYRSTREQIDTIIEYVEKNI